MNQLSANLINVEILTWPATILITTSQIFLGPIYLSLSAGTNYQGEQRVFLVTAAIYLAFVSLAKSTFLKGKTLAQAPLASVASLIFLALLSSLGSRMLSVVWSYQSLADVSQLRFVTIFLSILIWNLMIALWVGQTKRHQQEISNLEAAISQTESLEAQTGLVLKQAQAKTIANIHETINLAWIKLNPGGFVPNQLLELVDKVVRPLSREIASKEIALINQRFVALTRISLRQRLIRWGQLLKQLSLFDPLVMPVIVAVLPNFTRTFITNTLGSARSVFTSLLIFVGFMVIGRAIETRQLVNRPLRSKVAWAIAIYSIAVIADSVTFGLIYSVVGAAAIPAVAFADLLICALVIAIRLIFADRRQILLELQAHKERLSWLASRTKQLIWVEQQRLSNLVHGHMQAQIIATAFKFEENQKDTKTAKELLLQLQGELGEILAQHNRTEPVPNFIESLKILWGQSIRIESTLGAGVAEALAHDQDAADATVEVIREALTNAAKHSRAKHVDVELSLESPIEANGPSHGYINIQITNDGAALSSKAKPGAGSSFFDAVSSTWYIQMIDNTVTFSALIPFSIGR